MKTTILSITDTGLAHVLAHFDCAAPVTTLAEARLLAAGPGAQPEKKVTNSRRVLIVAVDTGRAALDNSLSIKMGDTFSSAASLSAMMGYSYSKVSVALKAAEEKGERTAVVDGIEFQYAD